LFRNRPCYVHVGGQHSDTNKRGLRPQPDVTMLLTGAERCTKDDQRDDEA
jgi:hypothetical protein